jgi:ATP-dependent phosphofructokinase / diphosphate-dependent phosphofructokinase
MPFSGTAVIVHSGGPTPVLNASLAGIVTECRKHPAVGAIYGARHGNAGLIENDFVDLSARDVTGLAFAPGSALGSSRRKIEPREYERILESLRRRDARYLFYTGGNGSMETALALDRIARESAYELCVIGIPKTIDNDIAGTDHTPGYASCARFFAHAVRDVGEDNRALPPPVEIIEVLGRNVGWVVAATALARHYEDDPPHLIYFPECGITPDQLCSDVERVYRRIGRCLVAVCEGQKDSAGGWFGAEIDSRQGARNALPSNMGSVFARMISERTGLRARAERPGLVGRSSAPLASEVDREESWRCGEAGVRAALEGRSGEMVAIERCGGAQYAARMTTVPLERVAGVERRFPSEWIAPSRNDVTAAFVDWVRPLAGPVVPNPRL